MWWNHVLRLNNKHLWATKSWASHFQVRPESSLIRLWCLRHEFNDCAHVYKSIQIASHSFCPWASCLTWKYSTPDHMTEHTQRKHLKTHAYKLQLPTNVPKEKETYREEQKKKKLCELQQSQEGYITFPWEWWSQRPVHLISVSIRYHRQASFNSHYETICHKALAALASSELFKGRQITHSTPHIFSSTRIKKC